MESRVVVEAVRAFDGRQGCVGNGFLLIMKCISAGIGTEPRPVARGRERLSTLFTY